MVSLVVASSSSGIRTGDLRVTASSSVPSFPAMSSATRFDHLTLRPRSRSSSPRRAAGVFIADFSDPARTPPPGFEPATSGLPRLELTAASTTATVPPRGTSGTFTGAAVAGTPRRREPPPPPPPPTERPRPADAPSSERDRQLPRADGHDPEVHRRRERAVRRRGPALAPASEPLARCSAAAVKTTRTVKRPGIEPRVGQTLSLLSFSGRPRIRLRGGSVVVGVDVVLGGQDVVVGVFLGLVTVGLLRRRVSRRRLFLFLLLFRSRQEARHPPHAGFQRPLQRELRARQEPPRRE